jgi:hypothetical protein
MLWTGYGKRWPPSSAPFQSITGWPRSAALKNLVMGPSHRASRSLTRGNPRGKTLLGGKHRGN